MRDVGRAVEESANTMSAVCPNDAAIFRLGMLLDDVAEFAQKHARLDDLDCLI